jgi:hypothetical protein
VGDLVGLRGGPATLLHRTMSGKPQRVCLPPLCLPLSLWACARSVFIARRVLTPRPVVVVLLSICLAWLFFGRLTRAQMPQQVRASRFLFCCARLPRLSSVPVLFLPRPAVGVFALASFFSSFLLVGRQCPACLLFPSYPLAPPRLCCVWLRCARLPFLFFCFSCWWRSPFKPIADLF